MSTFRPPQVPQQPATYFTPGQPLGIPRPRTDMQLQQIGAYYRQRPDTEALEAATRVVNWPFTVGTPLGIPRPRQHNQDHAAWRQRIEVQLPPTYNRTLSGPPPFVPALALQIPAPVPRQSLEALQETIWPGFTAGLALGVPNPQQGDQSAAYYRQHVEILQLTYWVTAGTALGVPNPLQSDQTQATWRAHIDIPLPPPTWATAAQPLGVPSPRQGEQSAAYVRPHVEILQPVYSFTFTPTNAPNPAQVDQTQALWRQRIEIEQPVYFATAGLPLGISLPRQADQSAAYVRPHLEIPQTALYAVPPPIAAAYVPPPALPMPLAGPVRYEWLILLQQPGMIAATAVPAVKIIEQLAAYARERREIPQTISNFVSPTATVVPVQSAQSAVHLWRRLEIQQQPRNFVTRSGAAGPLIGSAYWFVSSPARAFKIAVPRRSFAVLSPARQFKVLSNMPQVKFDAKDPSEAVRLTFDFTAQLAMLPIPNVTLASATSVTLGNVFGGDTSLAQNGSPGLNAAATQVIVPVTAGLNENDYSIRVLAQTTDALTTLELTGILPVRS